MLKFHYGDENDRFLLGFRIFDFDGNRALDEHEIKQIVSCLIGYYNGEKTDKKQRKKIAKRLYKKVC